MLIRFGHEITVVCPQATPMVTLVAPRGERSGDLVAPERVATDPAVPVRSYTDGFGNLCRRFVAPAGRFTFSSDAVIRDHGRPDEVDPGAQEIPVAELPDEALVYLMGSRYIETDRLSQLAWDLFGGSAPGWNRVQSVIDWVHGQIRFDYQAARSTRTALDAAQERVGVCRDFAHLAIGMLRALNIPARYVNGYLGDIGIAYNPDPMDFAAWTEVYLGGRWYSFDPRNNAARIGRIVVARGRDAADVPLINSFGPHQLAGFRVWCEEISEAGQRAIAAE